MFSPDLNNILYARLLSLRRCESKSVTGSWKNKYCQVAGRPPSPVCALPRAGMDCAENSTEIVDDDSAAVLFRDGGRFWIHRGLQPLFCVVGLVGNLLTVVVLTRPRMRSSTNTYLAALALSDIAYLVTTWILTAEHYPDNKGSEYFWLWRHWGCLLWLHDAFSKSQVNKINYSNVDLNGDTLQKTR
ncbi:hypothetical protein J6590_097766 [Homalodisca vitripennis]|nr:hypothetical protein J6590_097766 [Homalodisca vitripennis]